MTEPNKELPKEVDELKSILRNKFREYISTYTIGKTQKTSLRYNLSDIAHDHYEPIIDGLKRDVEHYKTLFEDAQTAESIGFNSIISSDEKDATIAKLMGLLKERVWEDEYDRHYSIFNDDEDAQKSADKEWAAFCKSHGIDLGGE